MAPRSGNGSSSGEKDSSSSSMNEDGSRTVCNRHTAYQTQLLEAFYRDNPQPTEEQRQQLSREIGLDVKQIKFWYQNKKALTKAQVDRADNNVLRADNERMGNENEALKEALNLLVCSDCGGLPHEGGEGGATSDNLQELIKDNANLKQEFGKISKMVYKHTGKLPLLQVDSVAKRAPPSSVVINNNQQAAGGSTSTPTVMVNTYNDAPPMMMNNAALNQPQEVFGIPNSSPPMMMNNAALNQPQGVFGQSPPPPPMMMMDNAAALNHQGNFEIPTPPMMNNYDTAAPPQGIFGILNNSTLAPAPAPAPALPAQALAPAPDGLLMPDNNGAPNDLEPVMETDNTTAGVGGPTTLAELMKLLG